MEQNSLQECYAEWHVNGDPLHVLQFVAADLNDLGVNALGTNTAK